MGQVLRQHQIEEFLAPLKSQAKKIVFTNGCFDLLHVGHVRYLQEARKLGDILVVGVNSDASVKRLKGPTRPIQTEEDRAEILAALECVSFTILFEEDTPYELIKKVMPDILVKGGDWKVDQIVGSDLVMQKGGQVFSLQFVDGKSTTKLIEKSRN
ncbi:MAG: D-glycero-beta-D-manno-heptose 1-phosphate adenylyltransferase [Bdellovibrionia bacterium]